MKKSQRISCYYVDCLDVSQTLYSTSQITSSVVYIYDIIWYDLIMTHIYIYTLYMTYVMFRRCSLFLFPLCILYIIVHWKTWVWHTVECRISPPSIFQHHRSHESCEDHLTVLHPLLVAEALRMVNPSSLRILQETLKLPWKWDHFQVGQKGRYLRGDSYLIRGFFDTPKRSGIKIREELSFGKFPYKVGPRSSYKWSYNLYLAHLRLALFP